MSRLSAAAYYRGIPLNNSNPEKPLILDYFLEGVSKTGDIAIPNRSMSVVDADVALIQGFVHEHGKNLPHLQLRKSAYETQISKNKKALIVDSNLFLYANKNNPKHYLRYSFNGVFPTTGFYFDKDIEPTRWNKISRDFNISLKPYRTAGEHILICLQRHGGWSMRGLSTIDWVNNTITEIKKYSSRPIVVRTHPGDKKINKILTIKHPNITISKNEKLTDDFRNAWATVVYNSSPSVASIIEGVPAFLTDPIPEHSQAKEVANLDLKDIENPILKERQQWIEKISMCHWNFDELRSGEAWQFFRKYL
jgi:hypothetical protein